MLDGNSLADKLFKCVATFVPFYTYTANIAITLIPRYGAMTLYYARQDNNFPVNYGSDVEACPRIIQIYRNFANFARLYFPYFTTFRHQTLQYY